MDTVNVNDQLLSSTLHGIDRTKKTALSGDNPSCIDRPESVEAEPVKREDILSRKCIPATERKVSDDKKALGDIISAIEFTINHPQPPSFHKVQKEVKLKGASLLEGKYNLRDNCINTCMPLNKALQCNKDLEELGYRVGLSLIKEAGDDATTLFGSYATSSISGLIANSYLVFEHSDSGRKLVLDPTIASTLLRAKPSIMTFSELKDQIRSTLERQRKEGRCYSFPGGGFMPHESALVINRYIFNADQASELESATDLLFNAMYGKNVNPTGYSENEQAGLPIDKREVTPC